MPSRYVLEIAYFTSKTNPITQSTHVLVLRSKKDFLCFHTVTICVCMYVCVRATAYTVWARNLKFEHSTLLVTLQIRFFVFFNRHLSRFLTKRKPYVWVKSVGVLLFACIYVCMCVCVCVSDFHPGHTVQPRNL